jgi:tetratricopeptide (TPR) repeat protein
VVKRNKIVKELKRPDQFVDFWTRASHQIASFVGPRRKPAIAGVVALTVVVIGAAILSAWDASRRVDASRALTRIQEIENAELLPESGDTSETSRPDAIPRFKTAALRQGAVLKELDGFLAGHASAGLKSEALLMKGAALLGTARYDDAIAAYQAALDGRIEARLRFLAHEGLGYAHEGKGDLDGALAAFAQLATDANEFHGFYQDRALYHKARLTALKGDKPAAAALYRQVLDKVPDTAMHDEITDRLAVLEAK